MEKDLQKKGYTSRALIKTCIEYQSTKEATQNCLVEKMQLSPEAAEGYIAQYWR